MKKTLSYYKPYLPMVVAVVVFLFGQAMGELSLPNYMSDIINKGIVPGDTAYIYKTGGIMLGISLLTCVCSITAGFFAARVAAFSSRDIRKGLFDKVMGFSQGEMNQFSTASLITRSTNDIQTIQMSTVMILRMACFAPIMGIGALIRALDKCQSLTWILGLALGCVIVLMIVLFIVVLPKFKVLQSKLDKMNLVIGERLTGVQVIRSFTTEATEEKRFDDANVDLTKINIFVNRGMAFMMPFMTIIMNLASLGAVWFGAKLIDANKLMIGDMLAFLQYGMHVIISFLFVTAIFVFIPRAIVSANRIGEVLSTDISVEDKKDATGTVEGRGVVEFKNVSFIYPDADEKTLDGISFVAEPGKTTAIIGGTGSGKSSLISLIPRLFDVSEGQVLVDGVDVKDMTQACLRDKIGFIPQKGLLFSGTIAENLRFGKEDATEEEMVKAAETAQAMEFISELKDGFETEVAQGGTSVSGGQKQRLAIARALIKKPQIYVFDDSFSALDFRTDKALRKALKNEVGESTFIIVAQRINTIMDADQILVLDDGNLVGVGTHKELLASCEVYKEIASSQLSEEELRREGA